MADAETAAEWNAYYDKYGNEPPDPTKFRNFTTSSDAKHVRNLSFKEAAAIFKLLGGKGRIALNDDRNSKGDLPNPSNESIPAPNTKNKSPYDSHRKSRKKRKIPTISIPPPPRNNNTSSSSSSRSAFTESLNDPPLPSIPSNRHLSRQSVTEMDSNQPLRSKLNNDPNDPSLDSILEILRRATLVKKVQKEERIAKEEALRIQKEQEMKEQKLNEEHLAADLTTTDLDAFQSKEARARDESDYLFKTQTALEEGGGSMEMNLNPLIAGAPNKNYTLNEHSSEEELDDDGMNMNQGLDIDADHGMLSEEGTEYEGTAEPIALTDLEEREDVRDAADGDDEQDDPGNLNHDNNVHHGGNDGDDDDDDNDDEDDDGYESPDELFRNASEWDFTASDIVFTEHLNYGISLHLLHLGLTEGPLFPNSVLKWKRLRFREHGPTARSGHVAELVDHNMVIFGGYCEQTHLTDHIFIVDTRDFDPDNALEVTPISSLEKVHKTYRVGHCGVPLSHNSCLYLFGGWNDQQYINHGLLFNVQSLKLVNEQIKDRLLPPPRRDHTLCRMNTKSGSLLFLFGGWSHEYDGNELWVLSSDWKWKQIDVKGSAPCSRRGHTANVIGNEMFIVGGLYGFTKYLNDLHIYECDDSAGGGTWKQPELIGTTRPPPRAWHSSNVVGNSQILFYGGTAGRNCFYEDCWCYDKVGHFWFEIQLFGAVHRPIGRCSHSMVKIFEDIQFVTEKHDPIDPVKNEEDTENTENRKDRLQLIMFGGLVPNVIDHDDQKRKERESVDGMDISSKLKAAMNGIKIETEDPKKNTSDFSSDSDMEDEMENRNRIQLSDDLYMLSLEI